MKKGNRPVIMVFCDYYLPGYKSGGGMRTIVNMVDRLGDKYDFRIVTRDHDGKLDRRQYESVEINKWNRIQGAEVFFLSKDNIQISTLRKLINTTNPDAIYTNSFFSTLAIYVLKLRKLGLIEYRRVIVAPCGELASGALGLKRFKKRAFMIYAKLIRLYRDVVWKASTVDEALQVSSLKTKEGKIFVAPDLPPRKIFASYRQSMKPKKEAGKAKLVFLSRFVRGKNFNWILPVLEQVKGEIELDVIGPIEDREYWNEALRVIEGLPERIKVKSIGPIPHEQVSEAIVRYHFLLTPTLGENFGHIFLEALASGCPLIISDRTPWTDLEQHGSGWDMPLEKPAKWVDVLNKCVEMDDHEYSNFSVNAKQHANNWLDAPGLSDTSEEVLEYALGR